MSSKASHTPGPWVVNKNDPEDQVWEIDAPNGDPTLGYGDWGGMVEVYGCDDDPGKGRWVAEANARLIAAAPDMLYLLERIRDDPLLGRTNDTVLWADLLSLIAKATGETAPSAIPNETGA